MHYYTGKFYASTLFQSAMQKKAEALTAEAAGLERVEFEKRLENLEAEVEEGKVKAEQWQAEVQDLLVCKSELQAKVWWKFWLVRA